LDERHSALAGPAAKKLCERAFQVFGQAEHRRLAGISVSHRYNLRHAQTHTRQRRHFEKTRPTGLKIGYDAASRRTQMTVAGQSAVSYGYDNANRLTSITQGSSSVSIAYDNANRRTTLTLPNGLQLTYGFDNANELTGPTYKLGSTTVGSLTYALSRVGFVEDCVHPSFR